MKGDKLRKAYMDALRLRARLFDMGEVGSADYLHAHMEVKRLGRLIRESDKTKKETA